MSEHGSKAATADGAHAGETRRDFIHIAAATVAAGGVAAVAWPFVQQLAPAGDTKADDPDPPEPTKLPPPPTNASPPCKKPSASSRTTCARS